ncbi:MAG: copper amine oxidase N-terminal domain-containing protein [Clostridiales bacterium]|jgi:hypothetical protein|nr:copper amine oxidase N-terminal domain-containing protein [Clostridiales bacterium]
MKKLSIFAIIFVLIVAPLTAHASNNIDVFFNGKLLSFDQPPIEKDNRVFVPLRKIAETYGAQVGYSDNSAGEQVTITTDSNTIIFTLNKPTVSVNSLVKTIDVAPFELNGRTLVPIRYISEFLGLTVNWIDVTQSVYISTTNINPIDNTPINQPPSTSDDKIKYYSEFPTVIDFGATYNLNFVGSFSSGVATTYYYPLSAEENFADYGKQLESVGFGDYNDFYDSDDFYIQSYTKDNIVIFLGYEQTDSKKYAIILVGDIDAYEDLFM